MKNRFVVLFSIMIIGLVACKSENNKTPVWQKIDASDDTQLYGQWSLCKIDLHMSSIQMNMCATVSFQPSGVGYVETAGHRENFSFSFKKETLIISNYLKSTETMFQDTMYFAAFEQTKNALNFNIYKGGNTYYLSKSQ